MKGYKKGLNKFIEYVFEKYSKDEEVENFKQIYEARKEELETKKKALKVQVTSEPIVRISKKTADLCKVLVVAELTKQSIAGCYSEEYLSQLQSANEELISGYVEKLYSKILLERLKNESE
jgi:hypothetical protein